MKGLGELNVNGFHFKTFRIMYGASNGGMYGGAYGLVRYGYIYNMYTIGWRVHRRTAGIQVPANAMLLMVIRAYTYTEGDPTRTQGRRVSGDLWERKWGPLLRWNYGHLKPIIHLP
jgi:hypothetical protein